MNPIRFSPLKKEEILPAHLRLQVCLPLTYSAVTLLDRVLYVRPMTTMHSIPMLIEAARAGALPGKEFVVEAEAYRAAAQLRALNSQRNPAETRGIRDCYLRRHLFSRRCS